MESQSHSMWLMCEDATREKSERVKYLKRKQRFATVQVMLYWLYFHFLQLFDSRLLCSIFYIPCKKQLTCLDKGDFFYKWSQIKKKGEFKRNTVIRPFTVASATIDFTSVLYIFMFEETIWTVCILGRWKTCCKDFLKVY